MRRRFRVSPWQIPADRDESGFSGSNGKEINMFRTLGVVLGGIFAGAVVMEVVHQKCPDKLEKLYSKIGNLTSEVKSGFKEGYGSIAKTEAQSKA
ncbi:hypothetical protein ACFL1X_02385 [Candidatus Hydrogenedentota bacterium]